ncbi:MAG: hypothetical protein OEO21_06660, partial [Candidatus Krumholzibacteria bacterium]|nr:hypothetical protein [Candidatus Krumholzibacteria bacterium]
MTRTVRLILVGAAAAAGIAGALAGAPALAPAAWLALMVAPGYALLRFADPAPRPLALLAVAFALSPGLTAALASLALLGGVEAHGVAVGSCAGWGAAALAASALTRAHRAGLAARKAAWLAGLVLLLCALTAALPLSELWWRIRSDAWFHRAVVYQIEDFGLPVEDPYFAGIPLQYMWFYHVLVLVLSHA